MSSVVYFKGLKFIRFFAASLVIVHHIEQFKAMFGLPNLWHHPVIRNLGEKGVNLFFVLSGFLITFLLLKEKEQTNTINIKYFYFRRILRIWPLYFLVVLSSLLVLPHFNFFITNGTSILTENFYPVFLLSIFILSNVTMFLYGPVPFSAQSWSIGVEEQFYLLWPLIIKYSKRLLMLLLFIVGCMFFLQNASILVPKIMGNTFTKMYNLSEISRYFRIFRIDCMAVGSIGAYLLHTKSKAMKVIFNRVFSIVFLLFTLVILCMPFKIIVIDSILQSIVFIGLILNMAANDNCLYTIENKLTNILGDISYGIYMYHPILAFSLIKLYGMELNNFFVYVIVFSMTIVVSYLSFIVFEKKLIMKKTQKYTVVKSS